MTAQQGPEKLRQKAWPGSPGADGSSKVLMARLRVNLSALTGAGPTVPRECDPSLVWTSPWAVWSPPSGCFSRHQVRPRTMASPCHKAFSDYRVIPKGTGPPLICWIATCIPGSALHFLQGAQSTRPLSGGWGVGGVGKARSLIPASPFLFGLSRNWLIVIKSWKMPYKIASLPWKWRY